MDKKRKEQVQQQGEKKKIRKIPTPIKKKDEDMLPPSVQR